MEQCPLQWKRGVLGIGPPGKSLRLVFNQEHGYLFLRMEKMVKISIKHVM